MIEWCGRCEVWARTECESYEVASMFLEHRAQIGGLHIDSVVNSIERRARLPVLRAHFYNSWYKYCTNLKLQVKFNGKYRVNVVAHVGFGAGLLAGDLEAHVRRVLRELVAHPFLQLPHLQLHFLQHVMKVYSIINYIILTVKKAALEK